MLFTTAKAPSINNFRVDTLDQLKAHPLVSDGFAIMVGEQTPTAINGGFYVWSPACTDSEDLTWMTCVKSDLSTVGRWIRVIRQIPADWNASDGPSRILNKPLAIVGDKGDTGATGPKGDKGDTGSVGATGPTGAQGTQGPIGSTGSSGSVGAQGPKGDTGATGSVGATGAQGTQGIQGATGSTGSIGLTGPAGASFSITDPTVSSVTLNTAFQPSTTNACLVNILATYNALVSGGVTLTVLWSATSNGTFVKIASTNLITLLTVLGTAEETLTVLCPAGRWLKVTVSSGTPTVTKSVWTL